MSDERRSPGGRRLPSTAWKPGQSGNPRGRPRSGNALAETIRRIVDVDELIKTIRGIALHGDDDGKRIAAATWLATYGFVKPVERHEVLTATVDAEVLEWARRLEGASDEQLALIVSLATTPIDAPTAPAALPAPRVIDVPTGED